MTTVETTTVPMAGRFLPEIRQLAWRAVVWGVVYAIFARGSRGGCGSAVTGDSVTGDDCYNAVLSPSPLVWLAMAVIFVVVLGRAMRMSEPRAIARVLTIGAWLMFLVPLVAVGVGMWWFFGASPDAFLSGQIPPWVEIRPF